MSQDIFRSRLFKIETDEESGSFTVSFDSAIYKEMIKYMYTPKHLDPKHLTYEEMRQLSILPPRAKSLLEYKNPQNWMPPASEIEQLSKNVQCLAEYYLTAGKHDAPLPNFLENGCLQRLPDGTIEYNLGRDSSIKEVQEAFTSDHADLLGRIKDNKKRRQDDTPQKGARRKLKPKATSTPKKSCEKK
ncbi:uncharacterized protein LOC123523032 [Mercenaria mercenaria]|uniref:uncharacterized protein LOC123523032 n=1 Tax=Mercenaria mercenaria TaxID=6596 RepID=UPI00234F7EC1|nr:uncharacterized protein LOC123523032 [Mercenaria mercenaria]